MKSHTQTQSMKLMYLTQVWTYPLLESLKGKNLQKWKGIIKEKLPWHIKWTSFRKLNTITPLLFLNYISTIIYICTFKKKIWTKFNKLYIHEIGFPFQIFHLDYCKGLVKTGFSISTLVHFQWTVQTVARMIFLKCKLLHAIPCLKLFKGSVTVNVIQNL